jgi:competence protein ComEA
VDPSSTPWRVLEDPPADGSNKGAPGDSERVRAIGVPHSAILAGGLTSVLAIGAFVVAFGSSASGSVVVDGGLPLESGGAPVASGAVAIVGTAAGGDLVVEIVGAVDRPGVFRLPAGSRIGDLVAAAGGYGPRVDADRAGRELNLAALLRDGDQVRVPSRDDTPSTPTGGEPAASGATSTGPIDLNQATAEQLDALPGIGPVTAAKILASRDEQPFAAVADLRTRKLVGEKTFEQLKDLVTVR